jgi:hypothetical protein
MHCPDGLSDYIARIGQGRLRSCIELDRRSQVLQIYRRCPPSHGHNHIVGNLCCGQDCGATDEYRIRVDILMGERPLSDSRNPLQDLTFFTALLFEFTMLTRASNYLPVSSAAYHLYTENIALTGAPPRRWGFSDRSDRRPAGRYSSSPHHRCFSFLSQIKGGLEWQRTSDSLSSSRGSSAVLCLRHRDYSLRICYRGSACPGQALLPCSKSPLVPNTSSLQLTITRGGNKTRSQIDKDCARWLASRLCSSAKKVFMFPFFCSERTADET